MARTLKVRIPAFTVEVDVEDWATEFGLEPTTAAVRADVVTYVTNCATEQLASIGMLAEAQDAKP